jgi:hypothetical protein
MTQGRIKEYEVETGKMPVLLQDAHRGLHIWLAHRIDSRVHAREAAELILKERENTPPCAGTSPRG